MGVLQGMLVNSVIRFLKCKCFVVEKGIGEKQDGRSTEYLRKLLPGEVWWKKGWSRAIEVHVCGEFCEEGDKSLYSPGRSAMLRWAILMFSSETLQPGKVMSASLSHLSSDQSWLPMSIEGVSQLRTLHSPPWAKAALPFSDEHPARISFNERDSAVNKKCWNPAMQSIHPMLNIGKLRLRGVSQLLLIILFRLYS